MTVSDLGRQIETARVVRLDVLAFLSAFVVGMLLYLGLRWAGYGQLVQTIAVVTAMIMYAASVWVVPRLKVRLDQAGDNAYYLGLLFTLSSMALALYEFRGATLASSGLVSRSGAEHIISNFGIALVSTIMGIFLRVILHQMRIDPADVESVSRIELADASKRVKASLDAASEDMALFHGQIAQRLNDVVVTATKDVNSVLAAFASEVGQATSRLLANTEQAQGNVVQKTRTVVESLDATAAGAQGVMDRLSKIEPPPTKLASRLEKVSKSLEAIEAPIQKLTGIFESTSTASAEAIDKLSQATRELTQFRRDSAEQQVKSMQELTTATTAFKDALSAVAVALQRDKVLLGELEERSRASAEQSQRAQQSADKVIATFTSVTQDLTEAIRQAGAKPSAVLGENTFAETP